MTNGNAAIMVSPLEKGRSTDLARSVAVPVREARGKPRRIDSTGMIPPTPFDPSGSEALLRRVLNGETKNGKSPDGIHHVYAWADAHDIDQAQLDLQAADVWGANYMHWHREVFLPSRTPETMPKKMLVVGVPQNASQLRFLLETYPTARVLGIEINPKNQEGAMATLARTRPQDVESGRVDVKAGDALELVQILDAGSFDFVETDKVFAHLNQSARSTLYQAIARVLAPRGVMHMSDILAGTWRSARLAPGFEDNWKSMEALEVFKELISLIIDVSFTRRGLFLWGDIEQMKDEAVEHAPSLNPIPSLSVFYQAPFVRPDTRGGFLLKLFTVMPYANLEVARTRQDSPQLQDRSNQMRRVALRSMEAMDTEGVLTALPDYGHLTLQRT